MTNFQTLVSNPSWDVIVILFFVAAGFFYGLFTGKSRLVSILISTYVAAFVFENFRYFDFLVAGRSVLETFLIRASSFFLLLIVAAMIISRFMVRRDFEARVWWQAFGLSFLEVGLVIALMFQFLPAREFFEFSPLVERLFAGTEAFSWWLLIPLLALWLFFG